MTKLCDPWSDWDGMREIVVEERAKGAIVEIERRLGEFSMDGLKTSYGDLAEAVNSVRRDSDDRFRAVESNFGEVGAAMTNIQATLDAVCGGRVGPMPEAAHLVSLGAGSGLRNIARAQGPFDIVLQKYEGLAGSRCVKRVLIAAYVDLLCKPRDGECPSHVLQERLTGCLLLYHADIRFMFVI